MWLPQRGVPTELFEHRTRPYDIACMMDKAPDQRGCKAQEARQLHLGLSGNAHDQLLLVADNLYLWKTQEPEREHIYKGEFRREAPWRVICVPTL